MSRTPLAMIEALDIHVKGIVQGVGFRPFIYRLAKKYLIKGWVLNAADGVHIRAEGEEKHLDEFVMEISENAPAAAQVTEIELKEVPLEPFDNFEIRTSDEDAADEVTQVSPDLATCADCARELFDENDHRYRYPFTNCTNCGPRFTIIDELPYDRARTSMRDFTMCDACQAEYDDPANRRFHAQPNACFECGPLVSFAWRQTNDVDAAASTSTCPSLSELSLMQQSALGRSSSELQAPVESSLANPTMRETDFDIAWGTTREESDAIFAEAVQMLMDGKILAVKGLGGFHLVCDARNAQAIATLRERKHRYGKAFAVMMESLDDVRQVCEVGVEEAAVLEGSVRPIVLLRKQMDAALTEGLADGVPELGVMLPYTPVQHILLHDFAEAVRKVQPQASSKDIASGISPDGTAPLPPMLVMTSGNVHDEPICISDSEAYEKLGAIADGFLGNNREILTRFDDSVVRVIRAGSDSDALQMIRRARGYAPSAIMVRFPKRDKGSDPMSRSTIFAAGPEQKNTFTFLRPNGEGDEAEAFVSQHIGDMENAESFDAWIEAKKRFEKLFDLKVGELACDIHPEYITTKWAHEQSALHKPPLPLVEVQHHHAHIASVIAESSLPADEAVCGFAFDGTGYGVDGNIWGGEVMMANASDFERFVNFAYVPMPGGSAAVKHPLQMAYGVLWEFDLLENPGAAQALAELGEERCQSLNTMIEEGINTPVTSSVGRLFDAASALLGICTEPTYEGQPAIELENALWEGIARGETTGGNVGGDAYKIDIVKNVATETSTAHDTSVLLFDAAPAFKGLLDDFAAGVPKPEIARRFHDAFVDAILQAAQLSAALYEIRKVALSGGVFMNRYLIENAIDQLMQAGFTVAINRELPPNDGCVSFGEAVVAWAKDRTIEED